MFRQTIYKLTFVYLAIMMGVSLSFSAVLYQTSVEALNHDYGQQVSLFHKRLPGLDSIDQYLVDRQGEVDDAKLRLVGQLAITNVIILGLGGLASYFLARRTLEPIAKAHEAQRRFTADASHELRTPIAAMQTEIEVALMDPKLTLTQATDQLRSNLEELARLTNLSAGLLRLAQVEENQVPKRQLTVNDLLQATIERHQAVAGQKKITLHAEKAPNLTLWADPDTLGECLDLLIDNALKYCPTGTRITLRAHKISHGVRIEVKDTGPGISPEAVAHLFDRFYRGDSSRSSRGYGLGLAIAKSIIDAHGGTITVKSRVGRGSSFVIELPG